VKSLPWWKLASWLSAAPLPFLLAHPVCLRSFALRHYFRWLAVEFNNPVLAKHKTDDPSTTKTGPATINQCGYCIAESIAYFVAFGFR
jgi:hypothetical protein